MIVVAPGGNVTVPEVTADAPPFPPFELEHVSDAKAQLSLAIDRIHTATPSKQAAAIVSEGGSCSDGGVSS